MRWYRWSLPLLGLVLAAPAPAQGVVIYNPYFSGPSFNYTRVSRNGSLSLSAGNYGFSSYSTGSLGFPYGSSRSVTIVTYSPPVILVPRRPVLDLDDDMVHIVPRRD